MWSTSSVLLALLVALLAACGATASQSAGQEDRSSSSVATHRQSRFFPFYTVIRFSNIQCSATNSLLGTCYLKSECAKNGGVAFGTCARKLGVCCVVTRNCGGSATSTNNTYYRSPGFPGTYAGGPRCSISVAKIRAAMCQIKLTFTALTLAQPDKDGTCVNDYLTVSGTDTQVPRICGENAGQAVYLKFMSDGTPIQIAIVTASAVTFARTWDIRVSQHDCNEGASNGCLMFFTGATNVVSSFNYAMTPNSLGATRQLASQQYAVCVRPEAGYCGIEWSQTDLTSFTVSGDTGGLDSSLIGTPDAALQGDVCNSDYVIVPNAMRGLVPAGSDRFCGNALPATASFVTPFMLTVVNDKNESPAGSTQPDVANRGFQITYRQIAC